MPLFLSESGAVCTKADMVATIEASAVRLQIPPVVLLGNRLCGEHNWHVSGAQTLAAAGVPEHVAAWRGPTVKRFMAEAPLASSYNHAPSLRSARSTRKNIPPLGGNSPV